MEMKKTFRWMMGVAALAGAIVIASCSDDDNPTPDPSDFVVNRDDLKGDINSGEVVLESGTYKLTGALVVKEGAKLTINPGVVVEATSIPDDQFASVRFIGVSRGAQIDVKGTAENPVVFTAEDKKPGAWGGLVLAGAAPTNQGETVQSEVGGLSYGGTNVNDNSGSVKYLRIEYSGYAYDPTKEFNGLSLFGVGNGTTIEYVQVHEGSDDGFEWFGGTVDARYLVATNFASEVGDDLFDWTEGWNGTGEYWYGIRTNAGNRGIEADNLEGNHDATPISSPTIKNLTLIGDGANSDEGEAQAIKLRRGTQAIFENVVLSNWATGIDIEHNETLAFVGNELKLTGVKFDQIGTNVSGKDSDGTAADVSAAFTEDPDATGAGAGVDVPDWAKGWTVGLE